ncbi:MAG: hypothetical protein M1823_003882 [Watsoniomyces obsoletus]|nr:MAG: hypothetical protein M1823_003882 [Watsoniomyces obsoletus]
MSTSMHTWTASRWGSPAHVSWSRSVEPDTLVMPRKTERQLQEELQSLIDAQGDGLMAGLSLDRMDDVSSEGSGSRRHSSRGRNTTSTASMHHAAQKRRMGLREARLGILEVMRDLAQIKNVESQTLQTGLDQSEAVLHQVDEWKRKKSGLEEEIQNINRSDVAQMRKKLQEEEDTVKGEIRELEDRLLQLRAKERHLASELTRVSNSVDAKLSSYQASLSILDHQVRQFLARPPAPVLRDGRSQDRSSFMSLPKGRRTLDMAQEHWQEECGQLRQKLEHVEVERDALEEGSQIWDDVVCGVSAFESRLRRHLRKLVRQQSPKGFSEPLSRVHLGFGNDIGISNQRVTTSEEMVNELVADMDGVISMLETQLQLSETRNWKLLVCCIGAELEAFREGKEVILSSLGPLARSEHHRPLSSTPGGLSVSSGMNEETPSRSYHTPAESQGMIDVGTKEEKEEEQEEEETTHDDAVAQTTSPEADARHNFEDEEADENESNDDPHPDLLVSPDSPS